MDKNLLIQRIKSLIEQIELIKNDTKGKMIEDFSKSSLLTRGTAFSLVQIGEQAIKLEKILKNKYPRINWIQIRGMRNFVVHDYGSVDIEQLYSTIHQDLDDLKSAMLAILNDYETGTLVTERLILRHIRKDDTEQVFNNWANDPEVTKYMTWNAHESIEVTKEIMKHWLEEEEKSETHRFVISLKTTGELIGMIDVVDVQDNQAEIGYCSGRKYWGNGYMTEACKAFMQYLFNIGYQTLVIGADERNIGSNRVIEKCGFTFIHKEKRDPISAFKPGSCVVNCYEIKRGVNNE